MKKLSTILIIAFAMVLGLTQCKKKVDTIATPSDLGKTVYITVNVGGDKHQVLPNTGAVVYTDGDKIYVGDGKKYLGTLTYGSDAFSGNITEPAEGDYLYFYFLGGIKIYPNAATTSYEISIADQSSQLPVLSFGRSTSPYTTSTATYGCTLLNKCGLVKFVPALATSETVTVGGMKTTATIDFADPGITPTATTGEVTLYSESNAAKWAILLVQGKVSNPTVTIAGYNSTITSVPAVTENMYYTTGVSIAMLLLDAPEGAAGGPAHAGKFSVSDNKRVWFSQGNLQYNQTTGKFSFMEYQFSTVETTDQDVGDSYDNQNIVSLFGWGTSGISGYSPIATNYRPWNTFPYDNRYNPYGSEYTNLYDGGVNAGKADWGYNAISNGGNTGKLWRTLTKDEWVYVFNTRSTTSGHRYAKATVFNRPGVILLPDNWSDGTYPLKNYNNPSTGYQYGSQISYTNWAILEAAGCVFLPAAGHRFNKTVLAAADDPDAEGYYWSSSVGSLNFAYRMTFSPGGFNASGEYVKSQGGSVRLVCEVGE